MAIQIYLERRPGGFIPVTGHDFDQIGIFPVGSRVRATISRSKSADMQAFYWAMVQKVAEGIGYTKENLSTELLINTRHVHSLTLRDGTPWQVPKSISKMDYEEFTGFVDAAIDLLLTEYIPGIRRAELLRDVEKMVGISYEQARRQKRT